MDTQRLVLFVIFSFSALLLWEAWQKEMRPPPPPAIATQQGKSTPAPDLPAVPATPAPQAAGASAVPAPGAVPTAPAAAAVAATGQLITITTDLYRAQVDTTGGTLAEVQLLKHRDPHDESKPYSLLLKNSERTNVAQSGLLGEGMPNHRSTYEALPGPRELGSGADRVEVRLTKTAPNGNK